jgi:hypothetical protein
MIMSKIETKEPKSGSSESTGSVPGPASRPGDCSVILTDSERKHIAEILSRRANEIATFKSDLEERLSADVGKRIRLYDLPGSVDLALHREITRLRNLADKVNVPDPTKEDDE